MKAKNFTQKDKDRIKEAVAMAEGKTSGEIVTYFVEKSDEYEEVRLRSTLMFVAAPLFLLAILSFAWLLPFQVTPLEVAIIAVVMGAIGYILPGVSSAYKRLLLSHGRLENAVERRAMAAFLTEEVFSTENRTGILIFISHFEHMVEVIGDTGINAKVDQKEWSRVVELIIEGIKTKDPVGGIVRGISHCGELLQTAGVDKPPDNPNELSDDIRIS
jgi:putative membrane protein